MLDMPPIVRDLFLSKKFLVAMFTAAGSVAAYFGWSVDPLAILAMATPFLVYIGAQGWGADFGKEKAKVEQETTLKLQSVHLASQTPTDAALGSKTTTLEVAKVTEVQS